MPPLLVLARLLVLLPGLPAAAQGAAPERKLYVSLGDSYATGYQPTGPGQGAGTRNGFAYLLPALARDRGLRLRLVNFGCGGETTTSILQRRSRCATPAVGGPAYAGRTQIAAAERFLRANRGRVALITVSIGGNDVTACARGGADPIPCVAQAIERIKTNVRTLTVRLRRAAGPKTRIVGITYPDVILGQWVTGRPEDQALARLSVVAFRELINPALKERYEAVGGRFADVTAATGAYGSLDVLVPDARYGPIPAPVAQVCRLTYYCQYRDIHPRSAGYLVIADLIARTLPRR
jgi:lysophospholipase L1-like esterase